MIALDTNLLVYAHRSGAPEHRSARAAIEEAAGRGVGWGFADTCLTEFWSVVTHPAIPGRPSKPDKAAAFIAALRDAGAQLWTPRPASIVRLLETAVRLDVVGPRIFDLRISLTVLEQGCTEIWTRDDNFVSIPGLRVVRPF
jgi:uncharacterized protein